MKKVKWVPDVDEYYYSIVEGEVVRVKNRTSFDNIFRTRREAEKQIEENKWLSR